MYRNLCDMCATYDQTLQGWGNILAIILIFQKRTKINDIAFIREQQQKTDSDVYSTATPLRLLISYNMCKIVCIIIYDIAKLLKLHNKKP